MKRFVALVIGLGLAAQARAETPCNVLEGGKVWLPGARMAEVDLVLRAGRIEAVGKGVSGAGCTRVDAAGKTITAGFVDPYTSLGLVEISGEDSTVDTELKALHQDDQSAIRAAVRASLGYNPRSIAIPVTRLHGVTSAVVVPTGGIVSGDAFWVDLAGESRAAIVREPIGMVANLGARSESRASGMHVFDLALKEALLWMKQTGPGGPKADKRQRADFATPIVDLEALGPVVRGEIPVIANVNRAADIESLLALTEGTQVRFVLVGGAEAWMVAKALAARKVPVIVDPLLYGPGGFDQLRARPDNAALLAAAGVPVLMSVMNTHQTRKLRQVAGNAVREGLRWEDALLAVTERPAAAFGLAEYGRLEAKAVANVVVWSGDPFELSTQAERVYIRGVEVPKTSRQTELRDRWRRITPEAP